MGLGYYCFPTADHIWITFLLPNWIFLLMEPSLYMASDTEVTFPFRNYLG